MHIILAEKLNGAVTVEQFAHIFSSVLVENIDNIFCLIQLKKLFEQKKPQDPSKNNKWGKGSKRVGKIHHRGAHSRT